MTEHFSNYKNLIESILDMDKKEIQGIEMKQTTNNVPHWTVKLYALISEDEKLANIMIAIDKKLRETFLGEQSNFVPTQTVENLTKFHKYKDPTVCIELVRSAKAIYSCNVKYYSEPNKEIETIDRIKIVRDMVLNTIVNNI